MVSKYFFYDEQMWNDLSFLVWKSEMKMFSYKYRRMHLKRLNPKLANTKNEYKMQTLTSLFVLHEKVSARGFNFTFFQNHLLFFT